MERSLIVPTSLKDIKLHQYLEFEKLPETLSDFDRAVQTISIFCEINTHEIKKIPYQTLKQILIRIEEALKEETALVKIFTYNNIEYGFVPNIDELSTAEFVDIDNYQKERDNLYKVMSVLYRPTIVNDGKRYDIESYNGKINESFQEMPMNVVKGAIVFFCDLGYDLLNYIQRCLLEEKKRDSEMLELQRLIKSGDGTVSFTDLLEATSLKLIKWSSFQFIKPYCGNLTFSTFKKFKTQS